MKGTRCKLPPRHWIFTGRKSVPRKVCASHIASDQNGGISPDAPDRTAEYESLGYVRIEVDEERGYTIFLAAILRLGSDDWERDYDPARPHYVWLKFEPDATTEHG